MGATELASGALTGALHDVSIRVLITVVAAVQATRRPRPDAARQPTPRWETKVTSGSALIWLMTCGKSAISASP
ncbi:hypothetical protein [Streptomyces sp. NPDC018693]|uniref:hypothetical protein n=1 Tax=unclassified Streptomyces TaxID=2593676 RepID=UPI00379FEEC2